jgi:uncharacterized protein (TIGR02444 family)
MKALTAANFWHFSCEVYSLDGMQSQLLSLQDHQDKNVNLCLLLLYLEKYQIQLTVTQYQKLKEICHDVDSQLLQVHRLLRQTLKTTYLHHPSYPDVRTQLLRSELALEKLQQSLLIEAITHTKLGHHSIANNLSLYLNTEAEQNLRHCYEKYKT